MSNFLLRRAIRGRRPPAGSPGGLRGGFGGPPVARTTSRLIRTLVYSGIVPVYYTQYRKPTEKTNTKKTSLLIDSQRNTLVTSFEVVTINTTHVLTCLEVRSYGWKYFNSVVV